MLPRRTFNRIDLVVIASILLLLALIIFIKADDEPQTAKVALAQQDIEVLQNTVNLYYLDNQRYPTQAQGLQALLTKPTLAPIPQHYPDHGYLSVLPTDPWGRAYIYRYPGQYGTFDLYSLGPKTKSKTPVTPQLIGNWQLSKTNSAMS